MEYTIGLKDNSLIRICGNSSEDCKRQFEERGLDQSKIAWCKIRGIDVIRDSGVWSEIVIEQSKRNVEFAKKKVEEANKNLKLAVREYKRICKKYGKQSNT